MKISFKNIVKFTRQDLLDVKNFCSVHAQHDWRKRNLFKLTKPNKHECGWPEMAIMLEISREYQLDILVKELHDGLYDKSSKGTAIRLHHLKNGLSVANHDMRNQTGHYRRLYGDHMMAVIYGHGYRPLREKYSLKISPEWSHQTIQEIFKKDPVLWETSYGATRVARYLKTAKSKK